jgi:aryl-alcohol dehydrogenase-like predicted oxidoreductase
MRQVELPGTTLKSSVLGMGCAPLGSRYGAKAGLRALEVAFDQGVNWFDVAPAYGAGQAEPILAKFLLGRRQRLNLCTKVGLIAPTQGLAKRLLTPLARPVVAKFKGVRRKIRQSGATTNLRVPLTAELIEQSITRSLARLGTDRVEVYALHDPAPEDVTKDEVLRALERVIARGQARYVAVAGELDAALQGLAGGVFELIQTADDPLTDPLGQIRAAADRPIATISHSVLGASGTRARLVQHLIDAPERLAVVNDAGFLGPAEEAATRLLFARAFVANKGGPVLASMFGSGHLRDNSAAAELDIATCEAAYKLVQQCFG